jgi:flagellar basal body-associated protein FliL
MEIVLFLVLVAIAFFWISNSNTRKELDAKPADEIKPEAAPYKVEAPVVAVGEPPATVVVAETAPVKKARTVKATTPKKPVAAKKPAAAKKATGTKKPVAAKKAPVKK